MASRLLQNATKAIGFAGSGLGALTVYKYQEVKQEESNLPSNELWSFKQPQSDDKKNVIIVGGGVVGVTAAYKLALKGHKVALLEPRSQPGKECSACAAGGSK